jgi:hypothetical protein
MASRHVSAQKERAMTQMQRWMAIVAAVAFLAVPGMVSAGDETRIPPEANWSPTPPASGLVEIPQGQVASMAHEQATDSPRPATMQASRRPLSLSAIEAEYQRVNPSVHTD